MKRDRDQHALKLDMLFVNKINTGRLGQNLLGLCLSICDLANEDGVLRMANVPFLVHVGGGDGKHCAVVTESQRCDAGRIPVELTQTLLVKWIPDIHKAI